RMCDHGHGGDGGGCAHSAQELPPDAVIEGVRYDMGRAIDMDKVSILNEASANSGPNFLKEWDDKMDRTRFLESDCDEELLINLPFKGNVRILGLCLIGEDGEQCPARIRLFKDREGMSFDDVAGLQPEQEIDLKADPTGSVDYPLKASKFNSLSHLSIHIDRNFGGETTKMYFLGLRGEYLEDFRQKVVIATYEARAIPKDHKGTIPDGKSSDIY
ncbi:hypothetical protein PENTCL1PPCAC_13711, partial [Pristionchus entomophagus]